MANGCHVANNKLQGNSRSPFGGHSSLIGGPFLVVCLVVGFENQPRLSNLHPIDTRAGGLLFVRHLNWSSAQDSVY